MGKKIYEIQLPKKERGKYESGDYIELHGTLSAHYSRAICFIEDGTGEEYVLAAHLIHEAVLDGERYSRWGCMDRSLAGKRGTVKIPKWLVESRDAKKRRIQGNHSAQHGAS
jgi:hypothetical protein